MIPGFSSVMRVDRNRSACDEDISRPTNEKRDELLSLRPKIIEMARIIENEMKEMLSTFSEI